MKVKVLKAILSPRSQLQFCSIFLYFKISYEYICHRPHIDCFIFQLFLFSNSQHEFVTAGCQKALYNFANNQILLLLDRIGNDVN